MVQLYQAEAVIFDQSLSPAQQRNLERHLGVAVADRTMLILEIFGERAQSHEGKLQVELARLQYLSTRLVRRWSHLERQRGGIGTRGGPGEAQIELDRRMIGERIKSIKKQLERVKRQRSTQRRARERNARSASPSSATPTPASRRSSTRSSTPRPMPPTSCSRRSTRRRASCTCPACAHGRALRHRRLHPRPADDADRGVPGDAAGSRRCRPAAARRRRRQRRARRADAGSAARPRRDRRRRRAQILVYNKLDRMEETERPRVLADMAELPGGARVPRVFVSALTGEGLDLLRERIAEFAAPAAGLNPPAEAASGRLDPARSESPAGDGDEAARTGTYHSHA
jgi:GTP-binding protein HflX